MKLLVNNPPPHPDCMDFVQPRSFNAVGKTAMWAADNDAFANFCPTRYLKMLDRIAAQESRPQFVTIPDVVGCSGKTYDLFEKWIHELKDTQHPRRLCPPKRRGRPLVLSHEPGLSFPLR